MKALKVDPADLLACTVRDFALWCSRQDVIVAVGRTCNANGIGALADRFIGLLKEGGSG